MLLMDLQRYVGELSRLFNFQKINTKNFFNLFNILNNELQLKNRIIYDFQREYHSTIVNKSLAMQPIFDNLNALNSNSDFPKQNTDTVCVIEDTPIKTGPKNIKKTPSKAKKKLNVTNSVSLLNLNTLNQEQVLQTEHELNHRQVLNHGQALDQVHVVNQGQSNEQHAMQFECQDTSKEEESTTLIDLSIKPYEGSSNAIQQQLGINDVHNKSKNNTSKVAKSFNKSQTIGNTKKDILGHTSGNQSEVTLLSECLTVQEIHTSIEHVKDEVNSHKELTVTNEESIVLPVKDTNKSVTSNKRKRSSPSGNCNVNRKKKTAHQLVFTEESCPINDKPTDTCEKKKQSLKKASPKKTTLLDLAIIATDLEAEFLEFETANDESTISKPNVDVQEVKSEKMNQIDIDKVAETLCVLHDNEKNVSNEKPDIFDDVLNSTQALKDCLESPIKDQTKSTDEHAMFNTSEIITRQRSSQRLNDMCNDLNKIVESSIKATTHFESDLSRNTAQVIANESSHSEGIPVTLKLIPKDHRNPYVKIERTIIRQGILESSSEKITDETSEITNDHHVVNNSNDKLKDQSCENVCDLQNANNSNTQNDNDLQCVKNSDVQDTLNLENTTNTNLENAKYDNLQTTPNSNLENAPSNLENASINLENPPSNLENAPINLETAPSNLENVTKNLDNVPNINVSSNNLENPSNSNLEVAPINDLKNTSCSENADSNDLKRDVNDTTPDDFSRSINKSPQVVRKGIRRRRCVVRLNK